MDLIGAGIVLTFVIMVVISGFAVQAHVPPPVSATTSCPATGEPATVSVAWDLAQHDMVIMGCDHRNYLKTDCRQACLASLRQTEPAALSTAVLG
jgi:hypothetical protein